MVDLENLDNDSLLELYNIISGMKDEIDSMEDNNE